MHVYIFGAAQLMNFHISAEKLRQLVAQHGQGNWPMIAYHLGGNKQPKQCRDRYVNKVCTLGHTLVATSKQLLVAAQVPFGSHASRLPSLLFIPSKDSATFSDILCVTRALTSKISTQFPNTFFVGGFIV
jgi:hypothetical protein